MDNTTTTNPNRQLKLFLAGIVLLGASGGVFETTFNNFLKDVFELSAGARGNLEFPRELPGFLVALFAGLLFFLPETLIAAFSALAIGLGMFGLAFFGDSWTAMMILMILWSCGTHMLMPIRSSIGMLLAGHNKKGKRLGQIHAVGTAGSIAGCAVVWLAMRQLALTYTATFLIGGSAALLAAVCFFLMAMPGAHLKRPRFVLRKQYWLYYVLAFLFGGRKQIFITFGPWVLIKVFHQEAHIIATLWMVASVLGIWFQPMLGRAIDRFGERTILMIDSVAVLTICLGYGYTHLLQNQVIALYTLYACFIADLMLFGVNMARTTYLSKIATCQEDVAPTLGMGVSINHAVSMTLPALGGWMWMTYGHSSVFIGAAGVAIVMFIFSSQIRIPKDI